jgi:hypothetical protein
MELFGPKDPENIRAILMGALDAFVADVPWGIIRGALHDKRFADGDLHDLVMWLIDCLKPTGKICIGCGPDIQHQAAWIRAMKANGLHVETITVLMSDHQSKAKCCQFVARPSMTNITHTWIIGRMKYHGCHSASKPFGMCVCFAFLCSCLFSFS